MNPKIIGGFLAGILVAGGSVFLLMRDKAPAPAQEAVATSVPTATAQPVAPAYDPALVEPRKSAFRQAQPHEISRVTTAPARQSAAPVAAVQQPSATAPTPAAETRPPAPAPVAATPVPPASSGDWQPAARPVERAETPKPPEPRKAQSITVTAGTLLPVRLNEQITSEKNATGDLVMATLSEPLVVNGFVIAERGARAEGRLVEVTRAGKVKGVAHLSVELTSFYSSDGQKVAIHTATFEKDGDESKKADVAKVGAAAGIGAIIGAIAGGGKGAAIGAGAGGAAGTGGVLLTRGKPAVLPVETKISFRITEPVSITERFK